MNENDKNDDVPELNSEKAYEILMNVFKECNVIPPEDCHKYFEQDSTSKAE